MFYSIDEGDPIDLRKYLPDYELISSCIVVPSWYNTYYGNMIYIKKDVTEIIKKLCDIDKTKCLYNQYASTYQNPKPSNIIVDSNNYSSFDKMKTRCYIKISFISFDIFCTHLEAYNQNIRILQLYELKENIVRQSIILGDFNIIDTNLYQKYDSLLKNTTKYQDMLKEFEYVKNFNKLDNQENDIDIIAKEFKWRDVFNISKIKPNFTSWSNTVVDYIFVTEDFNMDLINSINYINQSSEKKECFISKK